MNKPLRTMLMTGLAAALLVSATQTPLQMALALALLGGFASIYHPVGIPMLVQTAVRPGLTIGINGLVGNLGVAVAAVTTGFLVKYLGWRMAFAVPGALCLLFGCAFAVLATREQAAPAKKKASAAAGAPGVAMARLLLVMTVVTTVGTILPVISNAFTGKSVSVSQPFYKRSSCRWASA
jgi:MFS family permease